MTYLKKCNNTNLQMRLGQLKGVFNPNELQDEEDVIEPRGLDRYIPLRERIEYENGPRPQEKRVHAE
ncbi:hypothetical protein ASF12_22530 [Paenibacillus sp. Leaf72]|nr:hypothetical protein ASF12_22530 [Paenibacillus sp. Leaf72]